MVVPLALPYCCSAQLLSVSLGTVAAEWVLVRKMAEVGKHTVAGSKVALGSSDAGCTELPKVLLHSKHDIRR